MKRFVFIAASFLLCSPLAAQNNVYYQKVPKLIPQADGSYRVNTDEFYFVPVSTPSMPAEKPAEQKVVSEQPATLVVEKDKNLPGRMPYLSIGASGMQSQVKTDEDVVFKDTHPAAKIAFGGRISPYVRLEMFYQYRSEMEKSGHNDYGEPYTLKGKMQDIGANLFVYANPQEKTRFFIGAGLAATLVKPTYSVWGRDINEWGTLLHDPDLKLFKSKWCATPSFFMGVEFALSPKVDMDITAFYSHTNVHTDDIRHIKSYGLAANIRFNLPEKAIAYVK